MASTSSECIICTGEYFICSSGRGGKSTGKQKNQDVPNCNQKTWKTFIKYFFSPPGVKNEWGSSIWDLIDVTGMDSKCSPFCLRCRQIMEKLSHLQEQLEVIQSQVSKFVNTVSNIIVHPDKSVCYDKDGNKRKSKRMRGDDDNYDVNNIQNQINVRRILDERITKKKMSLHQGVSSRFNPQILHIPDWQNNPNVSNNNALVPATSTGHRGHGSHASLFNAAAAAGAAAYWQNSSLISSLATNSGNNNGQISTVTETPKPSSYEKFVHNGKYEYERLGNEFRCCTCSTVKSTRQLLMTHLNYHRLLDTKEYTCSTCGKAFVRKREVDRHERTHLNSVLDKYTGAVADLGNGRFSYEGEWNFEGISAPNDNGGTDRSGGERQFIRFRCSTCGVEKDKKSSMLSHLRWVHHRKQQDMHVKNITNNNNMQNSSSSSASQQQMQLVTPLLQGFGGHNSLGWSVPSGHQR